MRLQNDFGYIVRSRGDLGGYGNEILFLFNSLVSAKGQIISTKLWCLKFSKKGNEIIVRISALGSKMGQIKKIEAL